MINWSVGLLLICTAISYSGGGRGVWGVFFLWQNSESLPPLPDPSSPTLPSPSRPLLSNTWTRGWGGMILKRQKSTTHKMVDSVIQEGAMVQNLHIGVQTWQRALVIMSTPYVTIQSAKFEPYCPSNHTSGQRITLGGLHLHQSHATSVWPCCKSTCFDHWTPSLWTPKGGFWQV
jgi:hypothetical protein